MSIKVKTNISRVYFVALAIIGSICLFTSGCRGDSKDYIPLKSTLSGYARATGYTFSPATRLPTILQDVVQQSYNVSSDPLGQDVVVFSRGDTLIQTVRVWASPEVATFDSSEADKNMLPGLIGFDVSVFLGYEPTKYLSSAEFQYLQEQVRTKLDDFDRAVKTEGMPRGRDKAFGVKIPLGDQPDSIIICLNLYAGGFEIIYRTRGTMKALRIL